MRLYEIVLKKGRIEALKEIDENGKADDLQTSIEYKAKIARLYPNQPFSTLPHKVKRELLMIEKKEEEIDNWIFRRKHNDYILA